MVKRFLVLCLLLLCSCSAPKVAKVKYQEIFDFSTIQKYSLYKRDDEFNEWQLISDATRNDIEFAIENALDSQGFVYSSLEDSDVVITYHIVSGRASGLKKYNHGVNYCSYCLVNATTGLRADKLTIGPGHIILDAINAKTKRSIWRSGYPLNIKAKDNSQVAQEKIHQVIALMLRGLGNPKLSLQKS